MELLKLFLIFFLFSFVGYIAEIIVVSMEFKKITNRGFLCGPICPIYGVGGIIMWLFLRKYAGDYFAIFWLGAILATILEYFTGYALEKIFHNKWWDYSKHKFHLNGRVCMSNSILFGIGAIFVQMITPKLFSFMDIIPRSVLVPSTIFLIAIFVFDLVYSWIVAFNLRKNIIVVEALKNNKLNALPGMVEKALKNQIDSIRKIPKRTLKNFPGFILKYQNEFYLINKIRGSRKNRIRINKNKK